MAPGGGGLLVGPSPRQQPSNRLRLAPIVSNASGENELAPGITFMLAGVQLLGSRSAFCAVPAVLLAFSIACHPARFALPGVAQWW